DKSYLFVSSGREHMSSDRDWCSDVCSSGLFSRSLQRRDAVGANVKTLHIKRDRFRQPDNAELRGGVIGLTEIADQAGCRGEVDRSEERRVGKESRSPSAPRN